MTCQYIEYILYILYNTLLTFSSLRKNVNDDLVIVLLVVGGRKGELGSRESCEFLFYMIDNW